MYSYSELVTQDYFAERKCWARSLPRTPTKGHYWESNLKITRYTLSGYYIDAFLSQQYHNTKSALFANRNINFVGVNIW